MLTTIIKVNNSQYKEPSELREAPYITSYYQAINDTLKFHLPLSLS